MFDTVLAKVSRTLALAIAAISNVLIWTIVFIK